ncbi:leucine-rich repeat-containing protein 71 isoform X1 [Xiphophorus couchianus]|uniref:leucine-rich repeat-containing protein 71 isoform X1 n=1 Tax=Xiphophorus couchianus TaxID=32473 RepID=UPI001016166F|nr:leucine-rich repeat-containing protein 71 isoform X1 [Xiphophorus couchianus]
MSRKKQPKDKVVQEVEEPPKVTDTKKEQQPPEPLPALTFDDYHCTGNVEVDFPMLCSLLNMKEVPPVIRQVPPAIESEVTFKEDEDLKAAALPFRSTPCLCIELENDDPNCTRKIKISGWKVNYKIFKAVLKMLPSMTTLQCIHFWQAALSDPMVISLTNTSLGSNLRAVTLEGNPLLQHSFHLLLTEDSNLVHLSLRNNRIGEEGARLIGLALSTCKSANKNLLSLNLAFNNVGDAGATHIAQGLRLNNTLVILSLANNNIGDAGAAHLAMTLGELTLQHEEIVERRKMMLHKIQSSLRADLEQTVGGHLSAIHSASSKGESKSSSKKRIKAAKKDEKTADTKIKKGSDGKRPLSRNVKSGGKDKMSSPLEDKSSCNLIENQGEALETGNPLLVLSVHRRDGVLYMPGNTTLTSLNLAGNKITEKTLPLFLASLERQEDVGGNLQRLVLQRNLFPADAECYIKIKEMKALADPLVEQISGPTEEEAKET